MSSSRCIRFATLSLTVLAPMSAAVGQSSVAISPFVSYVPSASENPFAGLSLTFGGTTGLALRAGADLSIDNPSRTTDPAVAGAPATTSGGYRPWSADADAMLFLGGLGGGATVFSRALSPYLFSGIGMAGGDSAGMNIVRNGWSYGAGANLPLGLDADLFAEARWRMSQYVLPTAKGAPDSKSELRFGLSFHVGGGSSVPEPRRRGGGRRHRYDDDDDYADRSAAVAPVVVQSAPPQVVVVQSAPPVVHETEVNVVNVPIVITPSRSSSRSSRRMTHVSTRVIRPIADSRRGVVYRRNTSVRTSSTVSTSSTCVSTRGSTTTVSSRRRQSAACRTR